MSSTTALRSNAQETASLKGKIHPALIAGLKDMKFDYLTPVQAKVIAELPSFNSDCLVQAKTGTGKTLAFLLPAVDRILSGPAGANHVPGNVAILIISPTRELALQIAAEARSLLAKLLKPLEVHTAFGGTAKASNLKKFQRGRPTILVATPGRLKDYLSEEDVKAKFGSIQTLILDEADRMLDQGFLPDVLAILRTLPLKKVGKWQGMCFSATIPPKVKEVLKHILSEDYVTITTVDKAEPPTLDKIQQHFIVIPEVKYTFEAMYLLLANEIGSNARDSKFIVFGSTANLVALYAQVFDGIFELPVYQLHSRLSQSARTKATDAFKAARSGIMFASDVIGRGMDFADVSLVVQVGLPSDADAYTHRVGRTARAGKDGRAILLLTQRESFFLHVNRQFPIQPYPANDIFQSLEQSQAMNVPLTAADPQAKQKAYSAYLGFMKGFTNKLRLTSAELVQMANTFAVEGMLSGDVPEMRKDTVGKMGLKGVPGIRYASNPAGGSSAPPRGGGRPKRNAGVTGQSASERRGPSRRLRHQ